jgi:hypothetical protein
MSDADAATTETSPLYEQVTNLVTQAARLTTNLDSQVQHGMIAQALVGLAWSAQVDVDDRRTAGSRAMRAPARSDILATAQVYATLATCRP